MQLPTPEQGRQQQWLGGRQPRWHSQYRKQLSEPLLQLQRFPFGNKSNEIYLTTNLTCTKVLLKNYKSYEITTKAFNSSKILCTVRQSNRQSTLTCCPPATSTRTAKLVRWLLSHWTVVVFSSVDTLIVRTPAVAQWPLPILQTDMVIFTDIFHIDWGQWPQNWSVQPFSETYG